MSNLLRPCHIRQKFDSTYQTTILHGRLRHFGITMIGIDGQARIAVDAHEDMILLQIPLKGDFVSRDRRGDATMFGAGLHAQLVNASSAMDLELEPSTRMLIINVGGQGITGGRAAAASHRALAKPSIIPLETPAGRAFYSLAAFVGREMDRQKRQFFDDGLGCRLEDSLFSSLLALLDMAPPQRQTSGAVPSHVRRAEQFMADNLAHPVTLDDIVAAVGTSARTLHRTFRQVRGDSPLGVLKSMRLEKVHAELLHRRCGAGDITRIAMKWGFTHMGLFAADYRRRFGRTPSETIRQSRLN